MKVKKTAVFADDVNSYYNVIKQGKVLAEKRENGLIIIWLSCKEYNPVSICDLFEF